MISLITVLQLRSDGIFFERSKKVFSTLLIGVEGEKAPRRLPDRPRKATTCNGNQQANLTELSLIDFPPLISDIAKSLPIWMR